MAAEGSLAGFLSRVAGKDGGSAVLKWGEGERRSGGGWGASPRGWRRTAPLRLHQPVGMSILGVTVGYCPRARWKPAKSNKSTSPSVSKSAQSHPSGVISSGPKRQ